MYASEDMLTVQAAPAARHAIPAQHLETLPWVPPKGAYLHHRPRGQWLPEGHTALRLPLLKGLQPSQSAGAPLQQRLQCSGCYHVVTSPCKVLPELCIRAQLVATSLVLPCAW